MTTKERAHEIALTELKDYMQRCNFTNKKEALYYYIVEFYSCAGFDEDWLRRVFQMPAKKISCFRSSLSSWTDPSTLNTIFKTTSL